MTHDIIAAIEALGCGHNALAEALDVRPDTVQKWVAGKAEVPAGVWIDIARMARQRADAARALAVSIAAPEVAEACADLPAGVGDRLEWIVMEARMAGVVKRPAIAAKFGIGPAQATNDLQQIRQRLPDVLEYDPSRKAYVPRRGSGD